MNEMIERVAKAISQASMTSPDGPYHICEDGYLHLARAAIEAMREPTEAMTLEGQVDPFPISAEEAWTAMVDAALA